MSLYHEAAVVLVSAAREDAGSIESIVFGKRDWKSPPKTLFALAIETAKWSRILKEVIDQSQIIARETQLTGALALVLVHDLLLAKRGVALPPDHGLHKCVSRHKTRLNAELTKARLKEECSSIEHLGTKLAEDMAFQAGAGHAGHPRWIRINTITSSVNEQLSSTFKEFKQVDAVGKLLGKEAFKQKLIYHDEHVPNLVAIPPSTSITHYKSYEQGKVILQDKASCFPACLLDYDPANGLALDACAAPGNKTTHLAAYASERREPVSPVKHHIIACEKDKIRSETLEKMVEIAGATLLIRVKKSQNFLKLDPQAAEFAKVSALLLDPSCSGSGIVGRDEGGVHVFLPAMVGFNPKTSDHRGKKRKRGAQSTPHDEQFHAESEQYDGEKEPTDNKARLAALAEFQLRLLQHAMAFPAAERITYSTCSLHAEENENVVCQALQSEVARQRGWRMLLRDNQVKGMKSWHIRGDGTAVKAFEQQHGTPHSTQTVDEISEACIRCEKSGKDGTMGFFVAAFVRSEASDEEGQHESEVDDWDGFEES